MSKTSIFGGDSIERNCFDKIRDILPRGKTILELGSGRVTGELAKHYEMISIEHDSKWLNKYRSTYIYAPLVLDISHDMWWYDTMVLERELPDHCYDLILVDGPPAISLGRKAIRMGFYHNLDLFDTRCPMVFDDMQPGRMEREMVAKVSKKLGRPFMVARGKTHDFAWMP